ncbi:hypothetical protein Tco_0198188, partial [Tanacetum coccineum]
MVEIKTDVDGFCKECNKGIKLSVTKCMGNTDNMVNIYKNVVERKGAEKSFLSYQNEKTTIHGRKQKELKYMCLKEKLKYKRGTEKGEKKMAVKKNKIDSSKIYENSSVNKLAKKEEDYNGKQDGSKDDNNLVGSDFVLGKHKEGSWWLYHIKDPCEASAYGAMNLGTSLLESILIKPEICWCAACTQKGDKVKTTTPLRLDKMLVGFDITMDEVFVEACDYISEPKLVLADLGYGVER